MADAKKKPKKTKEEVLPNETIDMRGAPKFRKEYEPLEDVTGEYEDLAEDVIRIRKSDTSDKYVIVTRDPHGYSYIEGPNLPGRLQGAYTSYMLAKGFLDSWLKEAKK